MPSANNHNHEYIGVDICKYIMAFAVVAIHVSSPACIGIKLPDILEWFVRLAVPFFFVATGFFLQHKLDRMTVEERIKTLRQRSLQLIKLFSYWLIIYFPISLYLAIDSGRPYLKSVAIYVFNVVINGESSYAWPLWFIYSLSIVCLIWSFAQRSGLFRIILSILFVGTYLLDWFSPENSILYYINILTRRTMIGGIYVLIGMCLYKLKSLNELQLGGGVCHNKLYSLLIRLSLLGNIGRSVDIFNFFSRPELQGNQFCILEKPKYVDLLCTHVSCFYTRIDIGELSFTA